MSRAGIALLFAAGCASVPKGEPTAAPALRLEGQPVPPRALIADARNFEAGPGVVVLHYYGAGGWGIRWGHTYVLTAPYFSNHDLTSLAASHATGWSPVQVVRVVPNSSAVAAGFAGTPVGETSAILIGHGHIDHAGDVPAFFGPGLITGKPALIA
ncbi:MAG TPA: hypothetical protein VH208_03490, partial [Myxococcaceae bacterium]|nr:hypothetical protein [Myxococcaceae bacterium]